MLKYKDQPPGSSMKSSCGYDPFHCSLNCSQTLLWLHPTCHSWIQSFECQTATHVRLHLSKKSSESLLFWKWSACFPYVDRQLTPSVDCGTIQYPRAAQCPHLISMEARSSSSEEVDSKPTTGRSSPTIELRAPALTQPSRGTLHRTEAQPGDLFAGSAERGKTPSLH